MKKTRQAHLAGSLYHRDRHMFLASKCVYDGCNISRGD